MLHFVRRLDVSIESIINSNGYDSISQEICYPFSCCWFLLELSWKVTSYFDQISVHSKHEYFPHSSSRHACSGNGYVLTMRMDTFNKLKCLYSPRRRIELKKSNKIALLYQKRHQNLIRNSNWTWSHHQRWKYKPLEFRGKRGNSW